MTKKRCSSNFCIIKDGVRGRMFKPITDDNGIESRWCPTCLKIAAHTRFFAHETADMIRKKYQEYRPQDLPLEPRMLLGQFVQEVIKELGEEL